MASIHWPSIFLLTFTLILNYVSVKCVDVANDPKLYQVTQLTFKGDHSFPRFSPDKRYIYFSAKGDNYGKNCDEIYRLDLNYATDKNYEKISRVSTGWGHATRVSFPTDPKVQGTSIMYESSFEQAFLDLKKNDATLKMPYCPAVTCTGAALANAPCTEFPVEHYPGTATYFTDANGAPTKTLDTLDSAKYFSSPEQFKNFVVSSDFCERAAKTGTGAYPAAKGTCLNVHVGTAAEKRVYPAEDTNIGTTFGFYDFASFSNTSATDTVIFFSGRPVVSGTDSATGTIYSTYNTGIKCGKLDAAGTFTSQGDFVAGEANKAKLYPRAFQKGSALIYTEIDNTDAANPGKIGLFESLGKGVAGTVMTDLTFPSKQADINEDEDQIVFVRKAPGEPDFQIYLASLIKSKIPVKTFAKKPTQPDKIEWDYLDVNSHVTFDGRIGRLSKSLQNLLFELNTDASEKTQCKQVYHIDTGHNDFSSPRLISTGLGTVDGIALYEYGLDNSKSVIYSSDFLTSSLNGCKKIICEDAAKLKTASRKVKAFCQSSKKVKYVGKEFDLFQVNMFGNFEKRLTSDTDNYNGEPSVSQGGKMVYSRSTDDRVDLVVRDLSIPTDGGKTITNTMKDGYYGGASFSPKDEKLIVFHGTVPSDLASFKDFLVNQQLINITVSEIYTVNSETREHTQLTNEGKFNQNPVFTPNGKHVIFEQVNLETKRQTLWQIDIDGQNLEPISDESEVNATKLSFVHNDPNKAIFVGDMLPSQYDNKNPTPEDPPADDSVVVLAGRKRAPKKKAPPKPKPVAKPPTKTQIYFAEYLPIADDQPPKRTKRPGKKTTRTVATKKHTTTIPNSGGGGGHKKTSPTTKKHTTVPKKQTTKKSDPINRREPDSAIQMGVGSLPLMLLGYWVLRNGL